MSDNPFTGPLVDACSPRRATAARALADAKYVRVGVVAYGVVHLVMGIILAERIQLNGVMHSAQTIVPFVVSVVGFITALIGMVEFKVLRRYGLNALGGPSDAPDYTLPMKLVPWLILAASLFLAGGAVLKFVDGSIGGGAAYLSGLLLSLIAGRASVSWSRRYLMWEYQPGVLLTR